MGQSLFLPAGVLVIGLVAVVMFRGPVRLNPLTQRPTGAHRKNDDEKVLAAAQS